MEHKNNDLRTDFDSENEFELENTSSLPSRSEIHKSKKSNRKLKYPLIKVLALFFILIPIILYSWSTFFAEPNSSKGSKGNNDDQNFETIGIDNNKNTSLQVRDDEENDVNLEDEAKETDNDKDVNEEVPQDEEKNNNEDEVKGEENKIEEVAPKDDSEKLVHHTVQPNETLYRISMNYYKSKSGIEIIKSANNLQSDNIHVGQVLKIPLTEH